MRRGWPAARCESSLAKDLTSASRQAGGVKSPSCPYDRPLASRFSQNREIWEGGIPNKQEVNMAGNSNSGRKRQPAALHLINGNPSKKPLSELTSDGAKTKPHVNIAIPECPTFLTKDAKAE